MHFVIFVLRVFQLLLNNAVLVFVFVSNYVYKVRQFNSRNGCSMSDVTGVLSHASSCTQSHLDMFQLAFTRATDQMDRSSPSNRGSGTCLWYTVDGKMSDKNHEQRINNGVCVKISKSVSETLALITLANGEYTVKK
jgi:hypothetical protein